MIHSIDPLSSGRALDLATRRGRLRISFGVLALAAASYLGVDHRLARWVATQDGLRAFASRVSDHCNGDHAIYAILGLLPFALLTRRRRLTRWVLLTVGAILLAALGVALLKIGFGRVRPRLFLKEGVRGFEPFSTRYIKNGFPSGHASVAGVLLFAFGRRHWKWALPSCLAIALLRVGNNAHYLSDVLMGMLFGAYAGLGFQMAVERIAIARRRREFIASTPASGPAPALGASASSERSPVPTARPAPALAE